MTSQSEPPQDLVDALTGVLQCLVFMVDMLEKIFLEDILPVTPEGKNFFMGGLHSTLHNIVMLMDVYPEYTLSLLYLSKDCSDALKMMRRWPEGEWAAPASLHTLISSALDYALVI